MIRKSVTLSLQEKIDKVRVKKGYGLSLSTPTFVPKVIKNTSLKKFNMQGSLSGEKKLINLAKKHLFYHWNIKKINEIDLLITSGAKAALYCIFKVIASKFRQAHFGIVNPNWPTYIDLIKISGAKSFFFNTILKNNYEINLDSITKFIKMKKLKILIISSPNNPSGKIYEKEIIEKLINICEKNKCYLVIDESFSSHIFKEKIKGTYMNYQSKYLILVNSFSKNFHLQGLRLGAILTSKKLIQEFANVHIAINGAPNNLAQNLIINNSKSLLKTEDIKKKMNFVCNFLSSKGVEYYKPDGSFYLFPKILNAKKFRTLSNKKGLFYLDGKYFGSKIYNSHYRFCFEKKKEELEKIINLMNKYEIY
jgi:aspartate/methionine/tyrosine aminotransferase